MSLCLDVQFCCVLIRFLVNMKTCYPLNAMFSRTFFLPQLYVPRFSATMQVDGINNYRIDLIKLPWALIKFWDLESGCLFEVGTYWRLGSY